MDPTLQIITGAITAMGALGLAAFALVDAMKAWPGGGISNVGVKHILEGCLPFASALRNGAGKPTETIDGPRGPVIWQELLKAQWRNGRDKDAQKAIVRSLVRQGLTEGGADDVARFCNVDPADLEALVEKLKKGGDPTAAEGNMLGRIDAVIGFQIDAAFERADQKYRNVARVTAGFVAVLLGIAGSFLVNAGCPDTPAQAGAQAAKAVCAYAPLDPTWWRTLWMGIAAGILAVPIAPIAKDLTSSLSAAVTAVKAVRGK
ncbi:MAG TPA: hypothetical protein VG942_02610 [Hyphomonadaceae bacterium]|nr:hypothetical protein [Hyphomonadaceae bacterium]